MLATKRDVTTTAKKCLELLHCLVIMILESKRQHYNDAADCYDDNDDDDDDNGRSFLDEYLARYITAM